MIYHHRCTLHLTTVYAQARAGRLPNEFVVMGSQPFSLLTKASTGFEFSVSFTRL